MSHSGKKFNRRHFLKATGSASAVLGGAGLGFFGYEAGRNPNSYTGWKNYEGASQTFNRKRWEVDRPHYEKVGPSSRPDTRTEFIFSRRPTFMRSWKEEQGLDSLPPVLKQYYQENPKILVEDLYLMKEVFPKMMSDRRKYRKQFLLAETWSNAMGAVSPPRINKPPEESDFPQKNRVGQIPETAKFKNPAKTSKLIKKIAHELTLAPNGC